MRSRTVDLGGPVHFADFGGSGPTMVLVHGLGGSHLNWLAVGPALAARARVLAPDLAGFGRTPLAASNPDRELDGRAPRDDGGGTPAGEGESSGARRRGPASASGHALRPGRGAHLRRLCRSRVGRAIHALAGGTSRPRGSRARYAAARLRRPGTGPGRGRGGARGAGAGPHGPDAVGQPGVPRGRALDRLHAGAPP